MFIYTYVHTHKPTLAFKERKRMTECAECLEISPQQGPRARPEAGNTEVAEPKTWKVLPAVVDMLNVFKSLTAYWN